MTNQEQYELIWEKAKKYDRLVGVLDKIRAEIEQKCCITVGRENDPAITLHDVLQIIDHYKAESEAQERSEE